MKEKLRRKWHQPAFQEPFPDPKEHKSSARKLRQKKISLLLKHRTCTSHDRLLTDSLHLQAM